jgi:hypothetical protein
LGLPILKTPNDFIFLKHHRTQTRERAEKQNLAIAAASGLGFAPISASWVSACDVGLCFTCCNCCCCWVLHAFTVYMLVDFGCWVFCLQLGGVVVVVGFWMVEWVTGVEK